MKTIEKIYNIIVETNEYEYEFSIEKWKTNEKYYIIDTRIKKYQDYDGDDYDERFIIEYKNEITTRKKWIGKHIYDQIGKKSYYNIIKTTEKIHLETKNADADKDEFINEINAIFKGDE